MDNTRKPKEEKGKKTYTAIKIVATVLFVTVIIGLLFEYREYSLYDNCVDLEMSGMKHYDGNHYFSERKVRFYAKAFCCNQFNKTWVGTEKEFTGSCTMRQYGEDDGFNIKIVK